MSTDDRILDWLRAGRTLTPKVAYTEFGCLALHSAIARLRRRGFDVRHKRAQRGATFWGEYRLVALDSTKLEGA